MLVLFRPASFKNLEFWNVPKTSRKLFFPTSGLNLVFVSWDHRVHAPATCADEMIAHVMKDM